MEDIVYDGFSFVGNGCVITNISQYAVAQRDNQLERLANRNGTVMVQSFYGSKVIAITGYYDGATKVAAQGMYDVIVKALNRQSKRLDVPHAGGTRYYTATPQSEIISNPNGLNRITFDIEFIVPDGVSYALTPTTLISSVITNPTATIPLTVNGSVMARPAILMTFNSVTGGTTKTVSVRNSKDYVGVTFTRDFATGDTILIDSFNYQTYINQSKAAPNGRMPTWDSGAGALYYSDSLTTRTVTISATYIERNK